MDYGYILEIIKETVENKYFIYTIITITILSILKSLWDYRLYKKDCMTFNQKTKPIGFTLNSIVNIITLIMITNLGFSGYTAYNKPIKEEIEIKRPNKDYNIENMYKEPIEEKYRETLTNKENKPKIIHLMPRKENKEYIKPKNETAKEKLKRELQEAIKAVD